MFHKITHIATFSRPVTIAPGEIVQKFGVWGHVPTLNAQIEMTEAWYSTLEDAENQATLFRGYNGLEEPEYEESDRDEEEPMFQVVGKLTYDPETDELE